jgi:hypothetical protein
MLCDLPHGFKFRSGFRISCFENILERFKFRDLDRTDDIRVYLLTHLFMHTLIFVPCAHAARQQVFAHPLSQSKTCMQTTRGRDRIRLKHAVYLEWRGNPGYD